MVERSEVGISEESSETCSETGFQSQELTLPRACAREGGWSPSEATLLTNPEAIAWPDGLKKWHHKFLNSLMVRPVVAFACRSCNISTAIAFRDKGENETFAKCWDQALNAGWERVEEAAHVRAVDGVEKAIFGKDGQVIGTEVKYSDGLAELLLKANKPEKYRENSAPQVTVNVLNWSNGGAELPQPVEDKREVIEMSSEDCELLGDE